jgi:hypothetical protein
MQVREQFSGSFFLATLEMSDKQMGEREDLWQVN